MPNKIILILCLIMALTILPILGAIKIGAIFSITGPAAFLGRPEANTIKMLVDQINAKGGINGEKIEIIIKDSGGDPAKAFSFAKQLIEEEKVIAIIGPSTSGETMKIKKLCDDAEVILISCAAAEVIVDPLAKWVFKTPQKDSDAVIRIFETMKKKGISKIAVIASNTGFGNAGKKQIEELAPKYNMTIVLSETYDKNTRDFNDLLNKIKASGAQGIINWSIEPAQSIIPQNMKQLKINIPLFYSHGFGNLNYVKAAAGTAEGIIFPCSRLLVADLLPDSNKQKKVLVEYKKQYETQFKEEASTFGGHAWDAFMILVTAIEKAGSIDKNKIREKIETIKNFVGTGGIFNLSPTDHNGLQKDAFEMLVVKNDKFTIYKD